VASSDLSSLGSFNLDDCNVTMIGDVKAKVDRDFTMFSAAPTGLSKGVAQSEFSRGGQSSHAPTSPTSRAGGRVQVLPTPFDKPKQPGDFKWEIMEFPKDQTQDLALYVFNDDISGRNESSAGAGNARIRIFNKCGYKGQGYKQPMSVGISCSVDGKGFESLDEMVQSGGKRITAKEEIDSCIKDIKDLLATKQYTKLKYSSLSQESTKIAIGKGKPSTDVLNYVSNALQKM